MLQKIIIFIPYLSYFFIHRIIQGLPSCYKCWEWQIDNTYLRYRSIFPWNSPNFPGITYSFTIKLRFFFVTKIITCCFEKNWSRVYYNSSPWVITMELRDYHIMVPLSTEKYIRSHIENSYRVSILFNYDHNTSSPFDLYITLENIWSGR